MIEDRNYMIQKGCIHRWKKKRKEGRNCRRRGRNEAGAELQLSPAMSQASSQSRFSTLLIVLLLRDYSTWDVQQILLPLKWLAFKAGRETWYEVAQLSTFGDIASFFPKHAYMLSICWAFANTTCNKNLCICPSIRWFAVAWWVKTALGNHVIKENWRSIS